MILTTISGYLLSAYVLTKHYITTAELYIESLDNESASKKAETCKLLFTSPQMYDTINEYLEIDFSYTEYSEMISVNQVGNTQFLKVTVDCDNPTASFKLMNMYLQHLPEVIENYNEKATFRVAKVPIEPTRPTFPDDVIFTAAGAIFGFTVAVIGTLIIWKTDNTITVDDDITELFGIPLLGKLPDFDNEIDYLGR